MADIKIDEELLLRAGLGIGYAFAPFFRCDQCAKLEQCVHLREGALPDGVRPFPCVGCADGMRFKPCEEERCADFEQGAGFNNG